jgi:phosphatidylglycerophosphate synthase
MFLFGILGGCLFAVGTASSIQIGALSFIILNLCDTSDGELARLINKTSEAGDKLDKLVHLLTNPFMITCLGIGLWVLTENTFWLYYAALANSFYVMASAAKKYRNVDITKKIGSLYLLPKLLFDFQGFWHITLITMSLLLIFDLNLMSFWVFYCALFYAVIILKSIIDFYLFFKTIES